MLPIQLAFVNENPCPGENHSRISQKSLDKSLKEFKVFLRVGEMRNREFKLVLTDKESILEALKKRSMKLKRSPDFM